LPLPDNKHSCQYHREKKEGVLMADTAGIAGSNPGFSPENISRFAKSVPFFSFPRGRM
jgi:hypothetical protein